MGNKNLDYCYSVIDSENTNTANYSYQKDGYIDNRANTFDGSITFTATSETMYWAWSVSDLNDGDQSRNNYNIIYLTNAKLVEVTE